MAKQGFDFLRYIPPVKALAVWAEKASGQVVSSSLFDVLNYDSMM